MNITNLLICFISYIFIFDMSTKELRPGQSNIILAIEKIVDLDFRIFLFGTHK